ncbi:MAG: isoprenylcysteine carboxylmethyltransferase family protein [Armatimonadota bacterium]|nr:isoprenylcysteine carboxylmethyltransferase family protein [Armatimonadota bacterium]
MLVSDLTINTRKAVIGLAITGAFFAALVPLGFWWATLWIDSALKLPPIPFGIPTSLILASAFIVIGVFWITWAYSYLVFVGQGLPLEAFGRALQPTKVLVTTGPYAYTRNPMVLGALFVLLGVAFLRRSTAGIVLVPILAGLAAAYLKTFEEKGLAQRFSDEYERYRRVVPMLFPRVTRHTDEPSADAATRGVN